MKVIILSNTKYKENDVIFNAISETETLSFKAFRGQDNKAQIVWLNNPLTIAEVEFSDRRYKHPTLKDANLVFSPFTGNNSLENLYSISFITEVTNQMFQDEEKYLLFKDIEGALRAIDGGKDILLVSLIFLAHAIKYAGAELEINQCVFCGKTNDIVTFSFPDGGFVCRNCAEEMMNNDLSPNQMRLIRYIFKSPDYSCVQGEKYSKEDKIVVFKHLKEYVKDDLGVYLNSVDTLIK